MFNGPDRYFDLRPLDRLIKDLSAVWWFYLLGGLALILLGIAIVIYPELLAIMIAAVFIALGLVVLARGWQVRQVKSRYERLKRDMIDHEHVVRSHGYR